uniref:C-type lectin domain-containing protein n=1 Tax=Alexandrium catenella TaxID=2925 RepID=A0A7S1R9G2_ALECA|mmetsp:Transcript_49114/g.131456  ORF Transcript_49114/g.131456 Transcript_49114/m.131456 type:complete len:311 (+) Transcript_49114:72-1004(+)
MPPSARTMRAAAAIFAVQLLRAAAAEVLNEEECAMVPAKGGQLFQKASHSTQGPELAIDNVVTGNDASVYCYQGDNYTNCWSQKPPSSTPECTSDSGNTTCRCPSSECDIGELGGDSPAYTSCEKRSTYIFRNTTEGNTAGGSTTEGSAASFVAAPFTQEEERFTHEEVYCRSMVRHDQWKARHLMKQPNDPPAQNNFSYWGCWSPNTWVDGGCHRRTRYLGEKCWNGWFGSGRCEGSDALNTEYKVVCYKNVCAPYIALRERQECNCSRTGWNFTGMCTDRADQCDGHACVRHIRDGKFYCDFRTPKHW